MLRILKHSIHHLLRPIFWLSKKMSRKGLYPFLQAEFSSIQGNHKVLSVGSGGRINDLLLSHARSSGFEVVQVDVDPARDPTVVADICNWSQPDRFDVVLASEVLEHVHSPRLAISNMHASLKEHGRLILSTPFVFPIHDQPGDYFRFTSFGLELLLQDFRAVEISPRNTWPEAILVLAARTLKAENRALKILAPLFVLSAALLYPIAWLLGRLLPSDLVTTGYNVTARR